MDNYVISYLIGAWAAPINLAIHFTRIYTGIVQPSSIDVAWQAFACGYAGIDLISFNADIERYYQLGLAHAQRN